MWQVLDWLASGMTETAIRAKYPELETEAFRACLAFAAARFKPLDYSLTNSQEEDSEEWSEAAKASGWRDKVFSSGCGSPVTSLLKSEVPNKNSR